MPISINNSGSYVEPSQQYNSVWIRSVMITAPSVTQPIKAICNVSAWNSGSGAIAPQIKQIVINDVNATASFDANVSMSMSSIFNYVQGQVISQSIFQ